MNTMAIFAFLIICAVSYGQSVRSSEVGSSDDMTVCFLDFRISLEVGRKESDIQQAKYCKYKISRTTFLSLLVPEPSNFHYEGRDVRAMVMLPVAEKYFIDVNGVVRFGDKIFKVDKTAFFYALTGC